jgi:hypothetical protein
LLDSNFEINVQHTDTYLDAVFPALEKKKKEEEEEEEEKKNEEEEKAGHLECINKTVDVSHNYSKQYYCQSFQVSFWKKKKILLRMKKQLNILRK